VREVVLNFRTEGRGEPLLLVHGFGISYNIWRELMPTLRQHFMLVMVELPGIGATPMIAEGDDYVQACIEGIEGAREALGLGKWSVLGYSTGSRIAEAYVCTEPQHVGRAIFLCPLTIDANKQRLLRFGLWLDRRMPVFGTWVLGGWRLKFLIAWLGFNLQHDARLNEWYAEIGSVPVDVLKQTIRAVADDAGGDFSVPVPHGMIWGDRDLVPLVPQQPAEHDHFVHGRHAAPLEAADEIARAVIAIANAGNASQ
jgi:pimeloyl-ACP methyl ester carboxylesterase